MSTSLLKAKAAFIGFFRFFAMLLQRPPDSTRSGRGDVGVGGGGNGGLFPDIVVVLVRHLERLTGDRVLGERVAGTSLGPQPGLHVVGLGGLGKHTEWCSSSAWHQCRLLLRRTGRPAACR